MGTRNCFQSLFLQLCCIWIPFQVITLHFKITVVCWKGVSKITSAMIVLISYPPVMSMLYNTPECRWMITNQWHNYYYYSFRSKCRINLMDIVKFFPNLNSTVVRTCLELLLMFEISLHFQGTTINLLSFFPNWLRNSLKRGIFKVLLSLNLYPHFDHDRVLLSDSSTINHTSKWSVITFKVGITLISNYYLQLNSTQNTTDIVTDRPSNKTTLFRWSEVLSAQKLFCTLCTSMYPYTGL